MLEVIDKGCATAAHPDMGHDVMLEPTWRPLRWYMAHGTSIPGAY
jgi:hypothetical protein